MSTSKENNENYNEAAIIAEELIGKQNMYQRKKQVPPRYLTSHNAVLLVLM